MAGEPGVPEQGIAIDCGKEGPVSEQEVNPTRDRRPAANACWLSANVEPFGGDKGIEAMELLKFHVEIAPDEAGDPAGTFRIQKRISAQGAGIKEAVRGTVCVSINVVQTHRVTTPSVPNNTHKPGA